MYGVILNNVERFVKIRPLLLFTSYDEFQIFAVFYKNAAYKYVTFTIHEDCFPSMYMKKVVATSDLYLYC